MEPVEADDRGDWPWLERAYEALEGGDTAAFERAFHFMSRRFEPGRVAPLRTELIRRFARTGSPESCDAVERLFRGASLEEAVVLYRSLPYLPDPQRWVEKCKTGIRSDLRPVFEAIAIGNTYPADHLPDDAFRQMILKAAFLGEPLGSILGLSKRFDERLSVMLGDFIAEREAAGRDVAPDLLDTLFRCQGFIG